MKTHSSCFFPAPFRTKGQYFKWRETPKPRLCPLCKHLRGQCLGRFERFNYRGCTSIISQTATSLFTSKRPTRHSRERSALSRLPRPYGSCNCCAEYRIHKCKDGDLHSPKCSDRTSKGDFGSCTRQSKQHRPSTSAALCPTQHKSGLPNT